MKRGFTLIELLVVIAIIGILASIIMVSLSSAKAKSRDGRRVADIKSIQLALSLYYNDNGMYPKNIYAGAGTAPSSGLAPAYLPVVPTNPSGGTCASTGIGTACYQYVAYSATNACNANGNPPISYHLGAAFEDTSNQALTNDIDADNPPTSAYNYTNLTQCPNTNLNTFNGNAATCTGPNAATPDPCYDQAP